MNRQLSQIVFINRVFQRSARLDQDFAANSPELIERYVPQGSALEILERMGEHLLHTSQRAFTWTGPYGSGKSSLALMLCALMRGGPARRAALKRLALSEDSAALKAFGRGPAWEIIPITGREGRLADDLARVLDCEATDKAIEESFHDHVALQPASGGTLLIIDELGKYLEADCASENSYLLQELAETASRTGRKCALVGILHQAFDAYAARLPKELRLEWEKVKGRFVDMPLLASADEMVGLIAEAIRTSKDENTLPEKFLSAVKTAATDLAARRKYHGAELEKTLVACWPLNPVVALLLGPVSRRSFAQNERSVFSFLSSSEPYGFREFLEAEDEDALYSPADYWDYLKANFEPAIMATPDAHRWAMASDAVERATEKGGAEHAGLMKTLALIYLFRQGAGIEATLPMLAAGLALPEAKTKALLSDLSGWKCVIERRFAGVWSIFAGSDFDIEATLSDALTKADGLNPALIHSLVSLPPVIARSHYMRTGTLRWFERVVVPAEHLERHFARKREDDGMTGTFLLVLPEAGDESSAEETLQSIGTQCRCLAKGGLITIPGIPKESQKLRSLLAELQAMHTVASAPELEGDEAARHETAHRIARLEALLSEALTGAFASALWLVNGRKRKAVSQRSLPDFANETSDLVFEAAPIIRNELINRDHLSGNLVSARRTLMEAMFQHESEENLGYKGFPPDYALYLSMLKNQHRRGSDGKLRFSAEGANSRFWELTTNWLESQESITAKDLYAYWRKAPFGLKFGPMPILALFFYLANRDRIALYENGAFTPEFSLEILDEWLASPDRIGLRAVKESGWNQTLVAALAEKLAPFSAVAPESTPLGVARAIVQIVLTSPKWSQRSSSFSPATQKFKQAAMKASDPVDFLFREIPAIFGETDPEKLALAVETALKEYLQAMPSVIDRMRSLVLDAIKGKEGDYATINRRAAAVRGLSGKLILEAFTSRLEKFTGNKTDIEGFISLGCAKPQFQWSDADLKTAETKLSALGFEFRQLEATAGLRGRPASRRMFRIVTGSSKGDLDEVLDLSGDEEKEASAVASKLSALLKGKNRTVALAALADACAALAKEKP